MTDALPNEKYFVLTKIRGVIRSEGKIFLCKLAKGPGFYCLPGGTLEPGETRKECLEREIVEELGIEPVIGNLVYTQEFVRPEEGVTMFDFWYAIENAADFERVDVLRCTHGFEHTEVGFYAEKDLFGEDVRPERLWELVRAWDAGGAGFIQNN